MSKSREVLHPGSPLELVGAEEGDNGFRHRVPALTKVLSREERVDLLARREERLSLYAKTAERAATEAVLPGNRGAAKSESPRTRATSEVAKPEEPRGGRLGFFQSLMYGIGAAGVLAFLFRGRLS